MQVIIYPNETTISIMRPLDCGLALDEIARKDVPFGVPYLIIDESMIPEDRTYRSAWQADFTNPDGHGLGNNRWWIEQFLAEIARLEEQKESEARDAAISALQEKIEIVKAEVLKNEGVQL